ncbi:hypothetical protein K439DRAFT_861595 [Ramaria rubella]|nr:hypothetical protein K439DRAFT_861595 [Ramaria rubella]
MKHESPGSDFTLESLSSEILGRIALDTILPTYGNPTPRDLMSVRSLVLTNRGIYRKLSLANNPHLYGCIFGLIFDIEAVNRRFGAHAVVSSALAFELTRRVETLKRFRVYLENLSDVSVNFQTNLTDLTRMFLMMTESDGKNRQHLFEIFNSSHMHTDILSWLVKISTNREELVYHPEFTLIMALVWFICEKDHEDPTHLDNMLEILEPLAALEDARSSRVASIEYFGLRCQIMLPPSALFSRLYTVKLYDAVRRHSTCQRITKNTALLSSAFDDDVSTTLTVGSIVSSSLTSVVDYQRNTQNRILTIQGLWDGALYIPCPMDNNFQLFTGAQKMQARLREYIPSCAANAVYFDHESTENNNSSWLRAWFPVGVEFDESANSFNIYDPTKDAWLSYRPKLNNFNSGSSDTIVTGETDLTHGTKYGDYRFHGRVRGDGKVALVREPAGLRIDARGTWVFHGYIFGQNYFVGDWRTISTTGDVPGGKGWFYLSRAADSAIDSLGLDSEGGP